MGLDGCGKCMKYSLIIANFFILVGGLAVMSVGIWTCVDKSSFEHLIGSHLYMSAAYILIVTGIIVVIISFIGCAGALRDIKCLLLTYFIILFIIFVIMLVGGILGYVFKNEVGEKMKARMRHTIQDTLQPGVKETWDTVQKELKCCGTRLDNITNNINAWERNPDYQNKENKVPASCCKKEIEGTALQECQQKKNLESIYAKDCYDALLKTAEDQALVLGGVGIGIACILILGMIFSMILFKVIE